MHLVIRQQQKQAQRMRAKHSVDTQLKKQLRLNQAAAEHQQNASVRRNDQIRHYSEHTARQFREKADILAKHQRLAQVAEELKRFKVVLARRKHNSNMEVQRLRTAQPKQSSIYYL